TIYSQWRDAYEPRPFNILEERVLGFGVRSRYQNDISANTQLNIGVETYDDRYDWGTFQNLYQDFQGEGSVQGSRLSEFSEDRSFLNVFAEVQQSMGEKWQLTAGINVNHTEYELEDLTNQGADDQSGDYSFDWIASPRIAVAYQANSLTTIYSSVSHGFSPPSLEETLAPDGSLNPDIQPETGWSYELGAKGTFQNIRLGYDINIYSMQIQNLLVAQRIAEDQFVGINAGSTQHNGLELALNLEIWNSANSRGQFNFSGAVNDFTFKEFMDGENDFSGNDLTGVPSSQWSASLDVSFIKSFYGRLEYQYVGEMPITDGNTIYSDSYQLLNAVLGWSKSINASHIDISYRANNIFNEKYASMLAINAGSFGGNAPRYYYPGLPIFHQVSVKYRFDW
ncbi:MAG: TonB-dependent receptor, partial [Bacteroidota bacterium]